MLVAQPMPDEATDEAAFRELWISFTSLLRSYLAMLQVVSGQPVGEVAALDPDQFEIRTKRRLLRLHFQLAKAVGTWTFEPLPSAPPLATGTFQLLADGRVKWSGLPAPAEMDAVAETVATMVAED